MTETITPLELLDRYAREHDCRVGFCSTARGPARRDTKGRIDSIELRSGDGPWQERDLLVQVSILMGGPDGWPAFCEAALAILDRMQAR